MNTYILDTNIISFYIKGQKIVADKITSALMNGDSVLIAPMAYYEIKRGLMAINSQKRLEIFNKLCNLLGVGQFDNSILDAASEIYVELRKTGQTIDDADIFIAAFCRNKDAALVTNNIKHFENITGLTLCDWTA
jgi:predicted nucleic acid-binding protein